MNRWAIILLWLSSTAHAATSAEFVGRWIHTSSPSMRVEVSENGSNYVVSRLNGNITRRYAAKLTDGILTINDGRLGIGADIERSSGNLIFDGQSYRRLHVGESFDYIEKGAPRF